MSVFRSNIGCNLFNIYFDSALSDLVFKYKFPVPTEKFVYIMPQETIEREARRKSGLSINSEDLEEEGDLSCSVDWPHLTAFELPNKVARRGAFCAPMLPEHQQNHEMFSLDDSSFELSRKHDERLPLSSTLVKSTNICSPILKEERGTESWRDFL